MEIPIGFPIRFSFRAAPCFSPIGEFFFQESFLEDISNVLSSGEVPNLLVGDELNAALSGVEKDAKIALNSRNLNNEQLYSFFIGRVRENLHVVFCMSPIGTSFRNYCRMYPSLVSNT